MHSTCILAEVHRRAPDGTWEANPDLVKPGEKLRLMETASTSCSTTPTREHTSVAD